MGTGAERERRLRWHCRRGMLELDLRLGRFVDRHLAGLTDDQLDAFEKLLEYDDTDLLDLLTRRREIGESRLAALVELVRAD